MFFRKKYCPVCGEKLGTFALSVANGVKICYNCEKMLRGRFDMVRRGAAFYDELADIDITKAKSIIDEMKKIQGEDIEKYGKDYDNIFRVLNVSTLSAKGLEEGGREIVALDGKCVAYGFCENGSFKKGEKVKIIGGGHTKETVILKLVPCSGAYPLEEELIVGGHKNEITVNKNAWLVLDTVESEISAEERIVKHLS